MLLSVLLLAGCGRQHQAKQVVREFLDENLVKGDVNEDTYSDVDSTRLVTENRIATMRKEVEKLPIFHKDTKYGMPTPLLRFVRTSYKLTDIHGKTRNYTQTFYLDSDVTAVVAFKQN